VEIFVDTMGGQWGTFLGWLAPTCAFVTCVEAVIEFWSWFDGWAGDWEIFGEGVSAAQRFGLEHLDTFQYDWFIQVQPVPLKGERSNAKSGIDIFEKVVVVDSHSFCLALVEADYSESGAFLEVSIFKFSI
jgi:hypothetical protein